MTPESRPDAATPPISRRRSLIRRVTVSTIAGLAVVTLSAVCAWLNLRSIPQWYRSWSATQDQCRLLRKELDERVAEKTALPESLAELDIVQAMPDLFPLDSRGSVLDAWRNPVHYARTGHSYTLISYGRDAVPGGTGFDEDLRGDSRRLPAKRMTLSQFLREPPMSGTRAAILVSGLCAAVATFLLSRHQPANPKSTLGAILTFVVTAGAAVVAACIMCLLHIPNYH